MNPGLTLKRALDAAAVWHRDQLRKYPGVAVPYISHAAGVAITLARHGFDDDVVAAGALHDVMEDCDVTRETLAEQFGERVAHLVSEVTEQDGTLEWEVRKDRYLSVIAVAPWEAKAIALADKIDNLRSILVCSEQGSDPWSAFNRGREVQLAYYRRFRATLGESAHPLVSEFDELLMLIELLP